MLWCSYQKQLHSILLSLALFTVIVNLSISSILLGCFHTIFSAVFVIFLVFLQVPSEQNFCLGTRDTAQGMLLLQALLFWIKSCFVWLGSLFQHKTLVGEEIWIQKGCSALLQACSLEAPIACYYPWHRSENKHYRAEGSKKRNKTKDKWEVRGLTYSDALRGQKNGEGQTRVLSSHPFP